MLWYETESSSSSQKMERKSLEFLTDLTIDTNCKFWKFLIHSLTYDHNMAIIEIAYIENVSQKPERCYNCGSYDLDFDAVIAMSANSKKDIPIKDVGTAYCTNCKSLMIHPENS